MRQLFWLAGIVVLILSIAIFATLLVSQPLHTVSALPSAEPPFSQTLDSSNTSNLSEREIHTLVFEAEYASNWENFMTSQSSGQVSQLTDDIASDRFPVLSPDGQTVAFVSWRDGNSEIYILNIADKTLTNISQHLAQDLLPSWSADGTLLAFTSNRDGNYEIYVADVARGLLQNITRHPAHDTEPQWINHRASITFKSFRSGKAETYLADIGHSGVIQLELLPDFNIATIRQMVGQQKRTVLKVETVR